MVTIKDIAQVVGVSPTTVSNVINGKAGRVSADTVARINTAIEELGYVPNMSARSLVSRSSKVIGFVNHVVTDKGSNFMEDPFLSKFIGILEHVLRENGYYLMLRTVETAEQLQAFLHTWDIDGLFLAGIFKDEFFDEISTLKIPIVLVDSYVHHKGICNVGLDDFGGSNSSTKYLIQNGHKKIAFINGSLFSLVSDQRQEAFENSMRDAGLEIYPELMGHGYYIPETAQYYVSNFIAAGATAILCGSDTIAKGVISECQLHGFNVPNDISVVGFDDVKFAAALTPPLTTVRQERNDLGRCAYIILNSLIHHIPISRTQLRPMLIERESTARVSTAHAAEE